MNPKVGDYNIVRLLGTGATAKVYHARHDHTLLDVRALETHDKLPFHSSQKGFFFSLFFFFASLAFASAQIDSFQADDTFRIDTVSTSFIAV